MLGLPFKIFVFLNFIFFPKILAIKFAKFEIFIPLTEKWT